MATRWVRVKMADDGRHITVPADYAEVRGLRVLRRPAVDRQGRPLPPKYPLRPQRTAPTAPAGGQPLPDEEHA